MPLHAEKSYGNASKATVNWLSTSGCLVLTYLRASYVPGATTDRKPVAKVLLHVLQDFTKTVIIKQT